MEAPRYTAKEIEDGLYSGMDPDVELVAAQYYDQMKAERDEWKRLWTDHQRCAQCGDWGYGEICRVCVVTAERDEIQRRLDEVLGKVNETVPLEDECSCILPLTIRAIAEGRDNG